MMLTDELNDRLTTLGHHLDDERSQWRSDVARVDRAPVAPFPRRPIALTLAVSVVVVLGALVTVIAETSDDNSPPPVAVTPPVTAPPTTAPPAPIVPPAPVTPEGDEYPIQRTGDRTFPSIGGHPTNVVDASSIKYWTTADATLFAFRRLAFMADHALIYQCDGSLEGSGSAVGCSPVVFDALQHNWSGSWDQPDNAPGSGLWQWSNVPDGTDFVQYRSGDLVLWQRPVDRMVAFPATGENPIDLTAVAYRADGAELGRFGPAGTATGAMETDALFPELNHASVLPQSERTDAETAAATAFTHCLTEHGSIAEPRADDIVIASLAAGIDVDTVWAQCLAVAQGSLDQSIAAAADQASN